MEPRYNEPRYNHSLLIYNEVLGITNNFLYPSNDKIYGIEPRNSEQILLVSWPFLISRFYCTWLDFERSFSVSRVKARQNWRERNGREYMVFPGGGTYGMFNKTKKKQIIEEFDWIKTNLVLSNC